MVHSRLLMNGTAIITLHGLGRGAGPTARPIFSLERVGDPRRQSTAASLGAQGAEPMRAGLPALLFRRVTLAGGLRQSGCAQFLAAALCPVQLSSPKTVVWGGGCCGLGEMGVESFQSHWPRGELTPFPARAAQLPPAGPGAASLGLGCQGEPDPGWGVEGEGEAGLAPPPNQALMSVGAANSPVESVSHRGWKYRAHSPSPPPACSSRCTGHHPITLISVAPGGVWGVCVEGPSREYPDSRLPEPATSQPGFSLPLPQELCDPGPVTQPLWFSKPIWYKIAFNKANDSVQLTHLWCAYAWDISWHAVAVAG